MVRFAAYSVLALGLLPVDAVTARKFHIGNGIVVQKIYSPPATGEASVRNTVYGQSNTAERMSMAVSFGDTEGVYSCRNAAWDRYSVGDSCRVFEFQGMFFNYGRSIQ
jgi:hypothetical protein